MNVLHVSDSYLPRLGGIELHLQDLITRQRTAGSRVSLATLTAQDAFDGSSATGEAVVRLPSVAGFPHPRAVVELGRMIASGAYDVVHAHSSVVSPLAWSAVRAATRSGVPVVLTMHSMLTSCPSLPLRPPTPNRPPRAIWTAVSSAAAVAMRRVLPGQEVSVLPNGIDPGAWAPDGSTQAPRPLTVVSVLRTARRKRPLALVGMLEAIRHELPPSQPLRAVLVGAGPLDGAVRRRLARSGADSWIVQAGQLSRESVRDLLHQSDLYLAPATLESFGIAALEARCAGLPVIGMARGGTGDFIEHGTEGFLVDSDAAMVAQASQLLADPARLGRMQHHNRLNAPAITWRRVLDQHADTYAAATALVREGAVTRDKGHRDQYEADGASVGHPDRILG